MKILVTRRKFGVQEISSFFISSVLIAFIIYEQFTAGLVRQLLLYLSITYLSAFIGYIYWHNQRSLLYLWLCHAENRLMITDMDGKIRCGSVNSHSKANHFGVWLSMDSEHTTDKSLRHLFIGCWQTDRRSFRALHRHINWYTQ